MSEQHGVIGGRYRLLNRIASGGMGTVWLAWDERLSRAVAIKQLHSAPGATEAEARLGHERAMREARITARLHHPNAVPVFDVVAHEGQPCIVMQYLPSNSLEEILAARKTLSPREAARIGSQVAAALAVAHDAGIVHRDVKPGNILITSDGTARITDFGISRVVGDVTLTSTGMVAGTPAYLAPEVARGERSSTASDVYSLGATLYAAVEGAPPFGPAENPMALLHQIASGSITRPRRAGRLTPLLERMLDGDPAARPVMSELAVALGKLGGTHGARPAEQPLRTKVLPAAAVPAASAPTASAPAASAPTASAPAAQSPTPTAAAGAVPTTNAASGALPTAAAPADAVPTAATPAAQSADQIGPPPVPAPATSPLEEPAGSGTRDGPAADHQRSRRALAVVAGAGLLVVALLVAWALQRADDPPGTAGPAPSRTTAGTMLQTSLPTSPATPSTTAVTTTARPPQTASSSGKAPASTPAQPVEPRSASGVPTRTELASAIRGYYGLLPNGTDAAWRLLTETYRKTTAGSRQTFQSFWDDIDAVAVSNVVASEPSSVVATLTYEMADGRTIVERTAYSLLRQDGILKIDRSSVLSSRQT